MSLTIQDKLSTQYRVLTPRDTGSKTIWHGSKYIVPQDRSFPDTLNLPLEHTKSSLLSTFKREPDICKFPKDTKLPTTNPHRGTDYNWIGDGNVYTDQKISLQIMLLRYGISDLKGNYNEKKEIHKKIDSLINTEVTMLICMKFKDLKHWRIFSI